MASSPQIPTGTNLPEGLQNPEFLSQIRLVIKQWTQLVAWSWSSFLAFEDDDSKKAQEEQLKDYFRSLLKQQAQCQMAALEYGDPQSEQIAKSTSATIKELMVGNTPNPAITLTLKEVYGKLTGTSDSEYVFSEVFTDFRLEVDVNSFTGSIREDETGEAKYVGVLAYPPRPALSEYTVTEQQLIDWMQNKTSGDYRPPSVYLPQTT